MRISQMTPTLADTDARPGFSSDEANAFARDGFVVVRGLVGLAEVAQMRSVAEAHLVDGVAPIEYEADTGYPGAPASVDAVGGRTPRRLLRAYARHPIFRAWATSETVGIRVRQLLGPTVVLAQAHHNCVMSKHPAFSSSTGWHQDIRYWSYGRPELVTVWLAMGDERPTTGGLRFLPGSHATAFTREHYDDALFFREDLEGNRRLLEGAQSVDLGPGDVVFFHARLLHAAGRNTTNRTKMALVFTYHSADNPPTPGTRSAAVAGVPIA
jgi:phytanoyl-CoA hydroxylase